MTPRRGRKRAYHCATCGESFFSKPDLSHHYATHADSTASTAFVCGVCNWPFDDSHALELHKLHNGHGTYDFACDNCQQRFISQKRLNNHHKLPCECLKVSVESKNMAVTCDCCQKIFSSQTRFSEHRSDLASKCADWQQTTPPKASRQKRREQNEHLGGYTDPDKPKHEPEPNISQPAQMHTVTLNTHPPVRQQRQVQVGNSTPRQVVTAQSCISSASASSTGVFVCNANGCRKPFRSEAGLAQHKTDNHGVGGPRLDMTGRDCWMLNQRERERLREEGLPRTYSGPSRGRGGRHAPSRPPPAHIDPMPTSMKMGGAAEMEQAKQIQAKALRLFIQSDIFIHHDGRINVCGIDWTRIGVAKQLEVIGMFDGMCHLPRILQGEHLPVPKAFKDEYTAEYPDSDFEHSCSRNPANPGFGVVALSCSKVVLGDGRQEVVKVAAVDLITCRILMNHLVCTDPHAQVTDWRSTMTGLFSWRDMDGALQAGYKIFKGWSAVRCALQKYVDSETIIVGHDLRSDLDAFRLVHGRAVDIAKVVEKAANGPLNKAQLSLDKLCQAYPGVTLKNDAKYGRDCLMNAFAVREVGLWAIKNKEKLEKDARQESLDYQGTRPAAVAVAGA